MKKNTKIVCTLGPATQTTNKIVSLIRAGMNVARLNFSHGDASAQEIYFQNIAEAEKITGQKIAILQDLQGPKIRLGQLPEKGLKITTNEIVIFSTELESLSKNSLDQSIIPVQYKNLHQDLKKHDKILIEDGKFEFTVIKIKGRQITARSHQSGLLFSHKGLNSPTASLSQSPLTPKDLNDLKYGLKKNVDFIALSFVRNSKDIKHLRKLIDQKKSKTKIIAKIERHEALDNLESIIKETDGVMVARGDLGVEIPFEQVPLAQRKIVHTALKHGKPVIIATEMLQSMITNPRPTRAEISDAATGIYQHADALMLSNESALGQYPVQAVEALSKVAIAIENDQKQLRGFNGFQGSLFNPTLAREITHIGAKLAEDIRAKFLVAYTESGYTAIQLSKQRLFTPIITITPSEKVARQLQLSWGLNDIIVKKINLKKEINQLKKLIKENFRIKTGDKVVIVSNSNSQARLITTIVF